MRLSQENIAALNVDVERPGYDRAAQACGIVHFGIGAFHRAHQAVYTDDAMAAGDRDWGITGVSLRSGDVADQMEPQDGLFTVSERGSGSQRTRLIGAVQRVLVAPRDPAAVVAALASSSTHIVSFTVTEKGYCRTPAGQLDLAMLEPELADGATPRSIYGFLATGLAQRRAAGMPGLTLVSCDNLAENGAVLSVLLNAYLDRVDPGLAAWFRRECACPSTMVDRIVPAVTDADRQQIADTIGMEDAAAVITEPFRQWVIEDRFAGPRPRWEVGGAQLVADVRQHEAAKLRMLNGAHSALAYLGLAQGHDFVHQAIADPTLRPLIEQLMRHEAGVSLGSDPGLDIDAYAAQLLARFANSALPHRLAQIAVDGSQKIPQRWLEPLAINLAAGRACPATLKALAAWMLHVRGDARVVDDPMAVQLAALWQSAGTAGIVTTLFGEQGLFADRWTVTDQSRALLQAEVDQMAAV
ncbi:mannitol dehydrogenase family protein [Sphingobium sp. Ant17]|uniref:mannitol dehydrogenase family protein n=1 Tax=Sphingobium sp. Ant17 TaxID=1461752 RepID=UPI00044D4DCE|nr:mannitol dehydrogenase family protein [Sphingobium sp. Ant17]EXS71907.1 dioxygenase [Sphingobium sp. Ant17]